MKLFAELFEHLDQTTKTNDKVAALVEYFEGADDKDKIWAIALLSGKRPRRAVRTILLREWAAQEANIPQWLFEDAYHVVGDFAEAISLLFPRSENIDERSLSAMMDEIHTISELSDEEKKERVLYFWKGFEKRERFVFNKLIGGSFRIGVSQKLMVKALSKHTGLEESELAHKLMGNWSPITHELHDLLFESSVNTDISRPYPFYLAYQVDSPEEMNFTSDLWFAERKWDGIRGQLIKRGGEVFTWSRGEELVTEKYPEFISIKDKIPDGTVLDGEILPFIEGQPLSFQLLQKRIGRKNLSKRLLSEVPVVLMAYDLLEFENEDIRSYPFEERREMLEKVIKQINNPTIKLSPLVQFTSFNELKQARSVSREHLSEGLMLKRRDSIYRVGRKRGDWWKWKVDPMVIDAVMIYAMRGHGRRANLYTDYTFAVWNDAGELVPFTKAYSGLTDEEIRQVDRFVRQNTIERFGPVRSVKPRLVFEIAFEGINRSSRHKSGIALRFPRMNRWRKDKKPEDANTLSDLEGFLVVQGNN